MIFENRISRVRQAMARAGMDCLLVAPSSDMFYLSGVRQLPGERFSCLLITADAVDFLTPAFEIGNLEEKSLSLLHIRGNSDREDPLETAARLLRGCAVVGVARQVPSWITLALIERCKSSRFVSAKELLSDLRVVKTEEEIAILKDVQVRSGKAFTRLMEQGLCGRTEREIVRLFIELSAEQGIDSKGPMVASGANTARPHHRPGDRVLRAGDVVFLDFGGADFKTLFRADTTRTFAIKRAPDKFAELYEIVLAANTVALQAAKPGVPCRDVDAAARNVIASAGYGECFTHRLGHGIGLDIHERPFLGPSSEEIVAAGQVFSDEPGIYVEGEFGVRTEDILCIRESGAERLTELPQAMMICD